MSLPLSINIRAAQTCDLPEIMKIQQLCYSSIEPESSQSMQAKLQTAGQTCLVAERVESVGLLAYFLAMPWMFANPPELDQPDCCLPEEPDCLYLHDLAVSPAARGTGAGRALVQAMLSRFEESGLARASLISIQNSAAFWASHGFVPVQNLTVSLRQKLSGYGPGAVYMHLSR